MELRYRTEAAAKFWRATVEQTALALHWGRLETKGQAQRKSFDSPARALHVYDTLVCEKLAKGYKPTTETMQALFAALPSLEEPHAIASLYIGEHVPEPMIEGLCHWMTCCLRHAMPVRQFRRVWSRLMGDQDDDALNAALSTTAEECWVDHIDSSEGSIDDLYAQAVAEHGTHCIWYNNNAYVDIVALRGDPGEYAIEQVVLGAHAVKHDQGVEAGAPIAWIWDGAYDIEVGLRDGTVIKHS